jgi:hypothetical protein
LSRGRRFKPRTREGRKRAAELGRIISSPRTLKADREAALRELDSIAPVLGSLSRTEGPKPTGEDLERLIERVQAKQASGSSLPNGSPSGKSILSAEEIRAKVEAWTHQLVPYARENALRKAKSAPDSERAEALLAEFPRHPLCKLADELARYIWEQDLSRPRPDMEQIARGIARCWLKREPYNRADIHGNVETVANAVADVYRLLAERDAEDPIWFVRRAEKLFDTAGLDPAKPLAVDLAPLSAPAPRTHESEPSNPIEQAETGLVQRTNLVLTADPNLSRLAAHAPEYDSGIRAAITRQLQEHGYADGAFLAGLYNASRPKNLSAFPPRTF